MTNSAQTTNNIIQHKGDRHPVFLAGRPPTVSSNSSLETVGAPSVSPSQEQSIPTSVSSTSVDPMVIQVQQIPSTSLSHSTDLRITTLKPNSTFENTTVPTLPKFSYALSFPHIPPGSSTVQSNGSSLLLQPTIQPGSTVAVTSIVGDNNTVAEFLYQLTKMLTEDNREVIEWSNGKIEVHNPHKLASDVLHKYFRHSKFASFQRQLNYFGFRKLAGKGKMAPCSYVNDAATSDLRSLLSIKRKTSSTTSKGDRKRDISQVSGVNNKPVVANATNPVLSDILHRSEKYEKVPQPESQPAPKPPAIRVYRADDPVLVHAATGKGPSDHLVLAQKAVGKGIRHNLINSTSSGPSEGTRAPPIGQATAALATGPFTFPEPPHFPCDMKNSLSELTNNYRNSLHAVQSANLHCNNANSAGGLTSTDSLVELAMLVPTETSVEPRSVREMANSTMPFVDFPHEELNP